MAHVGPRQGRIVRCGKAAFDPRRAVTRALRGCCRFSVRWMIEPDRGLAPLGLPVSRQGALAHPASPQPIGFEEVIEAPPFFMSARQQRLEHESHRVALGKAGLGEHRERRPGFGRADHEAVEA